MRMTRPIIAALAALTMLATPVLGANVKAPKADDSEATSPACSAYQFDQEGNLSQAPCHELGAASSSPHRAPQKPHDHDEIKPRD